MKLRFNSFDIICGVTELQSLVALRVNQIYDIDNKTYLIRFQGSGEGKKMLLIESGIRFHTTAFEWPKNMAPSGFTMKLRKHLNNKRLEKLHQLGVDRIVDFQFGIGEAACHLIVELYDRGNIVLTDHEMTTLFVLRPHHEADYIRFAVREKYPCERVKRESPLPSSDELINAITTASAGDSLRRIIMPMIASGPTVIDHVLTKYKLDTCVISKEGVFEKIDGCNTDDDNENKKTKRNKNRRNRQWLNIREFNVKNDIGTLVVAIQNISDIVKEAKRAVSKGFIIQKMEDIPSLEDGKEIKHFYQNIEYHPYNFCQYQRFSIAQFETFMMAVDEFYSTLEGQKIEMKTLQQEREALKKLSNVKKDHAKRIEDLNKVQDGDKQKAELITMNQSLVDNAILAIRSAIANQMSWPDIYELVKVAQINGDPVAVSIVVLKLEINHISLKLLDPYEATKEDTHTSESEDRGKSIMIVDVDLALSALANARKYYDQKRSAVQKEKKTIDASQKAMKSAERKTQQTFKDLRTISTISKARKLYWFEKFYWFISSENYLVIGGRDAQQNELIVKRYMRPNDIYLHAEIQGASSVVVRNPTGVEVPPKTLLEAGTMAISYSVAWDAKVVTSAYWVRSEQVSKTAPTGEYLGTGSFMIRGKKNFLPSCHLTMGISLLFKVDENCVEHHKGERKVRSFEEEQERKAENHFKTMSSESLGGIAEVELRLKKKVDDNQTEEETLDSIKIVIESEFPDTHVKIEHETGRISFGSKLLASNKNTNQSEDIKIRDDSLTKAEEETIIPAAAPKKKRQQNAKKRREEKNFKSPKSNQPLHKLQSVDDSQNKNTAQALKRGQKGKLKKINAKYKDQDVEERQLRMQILKSAGKSIEFHTDPKSDVKCSVIENNKLNHTDRSKRILQGDLDNADDFLTGSNGDMIDSLTGQPFHQDELLFVIPVVAPYQALQNYKYKIKLTPGTSKRGRAAKTALLTFSKDKLSTTREKELLKGVRDEALARNIPGKVKMSAPQLQKLKK